MKQRELQDADVRWTCVQAFAGVQGEATAQAEKLTADNGRVTVVCTPSGGAQAVRLQLETGWEALPDERLLAAIHQAAGPGK